jgi:sec-independent protein translocase protein TatC
LTLLRILSPRFLLRHSRYAILAIVIAAAIITPTPDVFNLMLFAIPDVRSVFRRRLAGLVFVLRREGRTVPWRTIVCAGIGRTRAIAGGIIRTWRSSTSICIS